MRFYFVAFFIIATIHALQAQKRIVAGEVRTYQSGQPIPNAMVKIEGSSRAVYTNGEGLFQLTTVLKGEQIIVVTTPDYIPGRLPIDINAGSLDIGIIYLERDVSSEKRNNLISLTDEDLADDKDVEANTGLLQATRDIFLSRAAFDFGQAFFKVRGYDSRNGQVLLNGSLMNNLVDGRPQWNNWGGLNDITRNQDFSYGLQASRHAFGGLLGITNIDTRPSVQRPGMRLTASASNRTYASRLMATYNSGIKKNGLAYAVALSRRWANRGYIEGTFYDAYSLAGSLEYRYNKENSMLFTAILASNRRGQSAAITEEVFELANNKYNPYWGIQNGEVRNSRERIIREPIVMLNHNYSSDKLHLRTGIAYQFGHRSKSRLGYFNAPNPDPSYYRYLPSFYINSPIGANFTNAAIAREGFYKFPQLAWEDLYRANTSKKLKGKAAYVLYDNTIEDATFTINSVANLKISDFLTADIGGCFRHTDSKNYAVIKDLLGAGFHEDSDPFSNTLNDVNGILEKQAGDLFNYNYKISAGVVEGFAQFSIIKNSWEASISGIYARTSYKRNGHFLNERYPDNSLGAGIAVQFSNIGLKAGVTRKISGRHWIKANAALLTRAPFYQNVYINPRDQNEVVPNIRSEKISSADLSYIVRMPRLKGRLSGFYTRFLNETDVNFFFVDSGLGSDFVQEVITDLDKLHMGIEFGLEYEISSAVKVSTAGTIGKYLFASDPYVSINFDTAGAEEDLIDPEGNKALGIAKIKDHKLSQGPQKALSLGVSYRDPKYWWIGMSANYLGSNYAGISTITRTPSFYLDPETGATFPEATEKNVTKLLGQKSLDDFYLLNVVGGKSWLSNGKYISVFLSLNNAFNTVFRTGGYEQSRNGNYRQLAQDNLSGTPSFAPKYWYGYGRTFFLNIAISF